MTGLDADLVDPPLAPGSPEWCREVTASKVAAILGLSPWTSRFSCYYELAGMLPHDDVQTANQSRGHYLEDAIARWFADEHGYHVRPGRCWRSRRHPWMVASPDRLVHVSRYARQPKGVLEVKTAGDFGEWGPDGSDDIPPGYRAQVIWQMDTLGLRVGYVAVLLPRLSFRSYVVHYDEEEAEWIRGEVAAFLDTLPGGPNEQVPDIDETDSTYETVRRLHPEIEDREVPVTWEFAQRFLGLLDEEKRAKAAAVEVKSEMAQAMGSAQRAVVPIEGDKPLVVATRQVKGQGAPYVAATRSSTVRSLIGA